MHNPDMRLSDDERQEALEALNEHVRTGRIDVEEFGDRSARATAARQRRDLEPLFADLPQPHPSVLRAPTTAPAPAPPTTGPSRRKASELALPLAAVLAAVLFFTVVRTPWVFALPVVVALLGPSLGGGKRGC